MPDLLTTQETQILANEVEVVEVIAVAEQGPPGPPGPTGDGSSASMFFQVSNRFFEIAADETAKQAARSNLGLATIDGGIFF